LTLDRLLGQPDCVPSCPLHREHAGGDRRQGPANSSPEIATPLSAARDDLYRSSFAGQDRLAGSLLREVGSPRSLSLPRDDGEKPPRPATTPTKRHCEERVSPANERRGNLTHPVSALRRSPLKRGFAHSSPAGCPLYQEGSKGCVLIPEAFISRPSLRGASEPRERTTRQSGPPTAAPERSSSSGCRITHPGRSATTPLARGDRVPRRAQTLRARWG